MRGTNFAQPQPKRGRVNATRPDDQDATNHPHAGVHEARGAGAGAGAVPTRDARPARLARLRITATVGRCAAHARRLVSPELTHSLDHVCRRLC